MHHGDTEELCRLHEDGILVEGGGVAVGVRVAQTPEAGPVVILPGVAVLLQPLLPLVHQLLEEVLAVGMPGRGGGEVGWNRRGGGEGVEVRDCNI